MLRLHGATCTLVCCRARLCYNLVTLIHCLDVLCACTKICLWRYCSAGMQKVCFIYWCLRPSCSSHAMQAIEQAHTSLAPGRLQTTVGELMGANANRSPTAYLANPADERALYEHNTDKAMTLLKVLDASGRCEHNGDLERSKLLFTAK